MTEPSAEVAKILAFSNTGAKLGDLLRVVAPIERRSDATLRKVALPKKISDKTRGSLAALPSLYGQVAPVEARALTPQEITNLLDERTALNDVEKAAKTRKDDQRIILHNHFDAEIEAGKTPEEIAALGLPVHPENGFYIMAGQAPGENRDEQFTRETNEGSPILTEEGLLALVESGDLDKTDYLAMTRQVRVIEESRVLDVLRRRPELVGVIAKATKPGALNASIYTRKVK